MQRIIVGHDGSKGSDLAAALVAGLRFPPDTLVRLVAVIPDVQAMRSAWGRLILDAPSVIEQQIATQAARTLDAPRERIERAGLRVETAVVVGRPPQALTEDARRIGATLMVVGSRGLGRLRSTLVGSVSAEIAGIAPCPVLVARSGSIRGILFATDGSPQAQRAERFLTGLPIAPHVPVSVVSVAELPHRSTFGITRSKRSPVRDAPTDYETSARRSHHEIAVASAARLAEAGIDAAAEVRVGDPAAELVRSAGATGADLIILGSRGHTIPRLILGSVAYKVLYRSASSVLIVRGNASG